MKKHIVSFSGGKDSTAMLLKMLDLGMQIDEVVFGDTGLEFQELYDYVDRIERFIKRPITRIRPDRTFFDWFFGAVTKGKHKGKMRGFPPQNSHCYWSREVKEYALKRYCYGQYVYIGVAKDEEHRAKPHAKFTAMYPLVEWGWTEQNCLSYLKMRGLENPLYTHVSRLGCWLCPKQNLQSLRWLKSSKPELFNLIIELEKSSPCRFRTGKTQLADL